MQRDKDYLQTNKSFYSDCVIELENSQDDERPVKEIFSINTKRHSDNLKKKVEINLITLEDKEARQYNQKEVVIKKNVFPYEKSNTEERFLNKKKKRENEEILMTSDLVSDLERKREQDYQEKSKALKFIRDHSKQKTFYAMKSTQQKEPVVKPNKLYSPGQNKLSTFSKSISLIEKSPNANIPKIEEGNKVNYISGPVKHDNINSPAKNELPMFSKSTSLPEKTLITNIFKPEVENKIIYTSQVSFTSNSNKSLESRIKLLEEKLAQKESISYLNKDNESEFQTSQKSTELTSVNNVLYKLFGATAKLVTQIEDTISNKLEKECDKCKKVVKEADLVNSYNKSVKTPIINKFPQKSNFAANNNKYFPSNLETINLDKNEGEGWISRENNLKPQQNEGHYPSIINSPPSQGNFLNFNSPPYKLNSNPFSQGNIIMNSPPNLNSFINSGSFSMNSPTYQDLANSNNQNFHYQKGNYAKSPINNDSSNNRNGYVCFKCNQPGHKRDKCPQNKI